MGVPYAIGVFHCHKVVSHSSLASRLCLVSGCLWPVYLSFYSISFYIYTQLMGFINQQQQQPTTTTTTTTTNNNNSNNNNKQVLTIRFSEGFPFAPATAYVFFAAVICVAGCTSWQLEKVREYGWGGAAVSPHNFGHVYTLHYITLHYIHTYILHIYIYIC